MLFSHDDNDRNLYAAATKYADHRPPPPTATTVVIDDTDYADR